MKYIIGFIVVIIIIQTLVILFYKAKNPFWNKLNGFHKYKWWNWFYKQQLVNTNSLTRESKYYKKTCNTFKLDDTIDTKILSDIIDFVNKNYMNYTDAKYSINKRHFEDIYSKTTYITIYDNKESDDIYHINGTIISIPFLFWCKNFLIPEYGMTKYKVNNNVFINIHYVDYLCVEEKQRNKNIAAYLIYSHLVNVKNNIGNLQKENLCLSNYDTIKELFLFKNEGFKTKSLVPVVEYNGYVIDLEKCTIISCKDNISVLKKYNCKCIQLIPSNNELLDDIINIVYNPNNFDDYGFELVSLFPKEIMMKHVLSNHVIIYCLFEQSTLIGIYFFKNINSLIDNSKYEFISCCSLNLQNKLNKYNPPFIYGFKLACVLCKNYLNTTYCANTNYSYDLCCVEEISHNYNIITKANIHNKYKYKIPLSYYTYNGLIHTKKPSSIVIIS